MQILDWVFLAGYLLIIVAIGSMLHRRGDTERGFVSANRSMPFWAAGLSFLATAVGADDFIGTTQFAFARDLSLLGAFAIGYVGIAVVAWWFLPAFFRSSALTIYGYLGERFGPGAQVAASASMVLSSYITAGIGMFIASFAVTPLLVASGTDYEAMRGSVLMILLTVGITGTLYTTIGGIRSVIWTDVLQMGVVLLGAGYAIWYLWSAIPLETQQMVQQLSHARADPASATGPQINKLQLFRTSGGLDDPYSPWTLPLWAVFFVGAFGTSHSYTQRLLTCADARRAGMAMFFGYTVGMVTTAMFLLIGLFLYLFNSPQAMGAEAASVGMFAASQDVYPRLVVEYFPPGLLGLSLAAMLAAVMSSFDSRTAALSSTLMADVIRPLRRGLQNVGAGDSPQFRPPIMTTAATGLLLTACGVFVAWLYDPQQTLLVDFALGFSSFGLGGMIGVFCTAVFTRRGHSRSVIAAFIAGPIVWLWVQPGLLDMVTQPLLGLSLTLPACSQALIGWPITLAWPWWFTLSTIVSFSIAAMPPAPQRSGSGGPGEGG